ncbi:MAG: type restriction enzyme subunit [Actinomycetota bacterium]|jgi:type I restriction enzyme S subunit|nr:type restriction enzyme subunit [Actinomycetota bacterium]
MSGWTEVPLGRGLRVHHGFAFKGEFFSAEGKQIVLTPGNFVERGGFKPKNGTEKYYLGPVPEKFLLKQGDVVIAMTEQAQGLLGSSATIPDDDTYLHNQRIGLLEVTDPELFDIRFVYHLMNSPDVRRQIRATATGSKVRHTAPERIQSVTALVPTVTEQRAVAEVLDTLDGLIANNRRRVQVLERMARAIYREWFVKFRYPGHDSVPLLDSAIGLIPEEWSAGFLDDIVSISRASVDPATLDPSTPAVGLEHIPRQQLTLDEWGTAASQGSRKAVFEKGDVLLGKIRPYFHKVSVAPVDGICSTDALVLRPRTPHWGQAVFTASSIEFIAHATQTSNGTKMPRADWKVLGRWSVPVPPLSIAESFTDVARRHLTLTETLMFENRRLAVLRDLLLPKLVTGQIDVSALDFDRLLEDEVA